MRKKESLRNEKSVRKKITALAAVCALIILSPAACGGEDFLSKYWERPIQLQVQNSTLNQVQGKIQNLFYPESCGECHKEQYNGWKNSLHSRGVGPGLLGQLNPHKDPESAMSCYFCHAPMEEQSEVVSRESGVRIEKNSFFDNKLKLSGVSCSVCHLREGKVYGPIKRKVKSQKPALEGFNQGLKVKSNGQKRHDFIEKDFFENAEFCAACHQMDEGYEINGKVLTNTYKEWKESIYAKNNITCQKCHMPDRQHLFRGIHDIEMVKNGITIDAIREAEDAKLVITNSGTGHYFPTYSTPLIVIKGFMLDKKGGIILSSVRKAYVGRYVSLDLSEERYDTRIKPQEKFEFDYTIDKSYNKNKLVFEIWVYPDEFYNRFYKEMLKGSVKGFDKNQINKALEITEKSAYMLYKKIL